MLSVFITPWMKPDQHPLRHQVGLARDHAVEQRAIGLLGARRGSG